MRFLKVCAIATWAGELHYYTGAVTIASYFLLENEVDGQAFLLLTKKNMK